MQDAYGYALQRRVRNVESAGSCEEAFLYFQMGNKEPDLVILDINLPDGDSFSLMQKKNTHGFHGTSAFLSARG